MGPESKKDEDRCFGRRFEFEFTIVGFDNFMHMTCIITAYAYLSIQKYTLTCVMYSNKTRFDYVFFSVHQSSTVFTRSVVFELNRLHNTESRLFAQLQFIIIIANITTRACNSYVHCTFYYTCNSNGRTFWNRRLFA